jgi:hypothetical protein
MESYARCVALFLCSSIPPGISDWRRRAQPRKRCFRAFVYAVGRGGIRVLHRLVLKLKLRINAALHLLKLHVLYHESDHVLNIAYNLLCGGRTLDDIEHRRQCQAYLDTLGTKSIPDPTTAGDMIRKGESLVLGLATGATPRMFARAILSLRRDRGGTVLECLGLATGWQPDHALCDASEDCSGAECQAMSRALLNLKQRTRSV